MKACAHKNCVGVVTLIGPYIAMWCFYIITKMKVTCYELSWFFFWVSGTIENHEGMWMDVMCKNHYLTNLSEKVLYQNILHWWNKKFFIFWLMNKNITSNSTWITFYFYINCKNDIACKYPNRK